MELNDAERFTLELLQEKDEQQRRESQQRMMRLLTMVAERIGIPAHALALNPNTGEVSDTRPVNSNGLATADIPG